MAQNYSSNGWTFSVSGENAVLGKPVSEFWEMEWSDTYGWVNYFRRYEDITPSSLSLPSSVTAQTIAWNGALGKYEVTYGNTYTVTGVSNSLTTAQREAVTSIVLPNTLTDIADYAFSSCTKLRSISMPASLTSIRSNAFQNDSSLLSITIPASVTYTGSYIFFNCTSLHTATVLNDRISREQFANCTALKNVTFSNNLTTVDYLSFANCPSVDTLTIPSSVINITTFPFSGLTGLKTLNFYAKTVPGGNFSGLPIEYLDLTGVETIATGAFANCTKLKTVVLSDSLKTINSDVFQNDSSLLSITIPASVTYTGSYIFRNCTSLHTATVLNDRIAREQFANCTALKNVTFSNNLKTIDYESFLNCPSVETLTIPSSVTSITVNPFAGLTGLKTLNFYAKTVPGGNFNGLPIEYLDLTGVETIATGAFAKCTKLKTVVLSDSLKTINSDVFQNDSSLLSITIPASVTYTGSYIFRNCTSLHTATVLNDRISREQFANCTALKNVTFSNNLKTIDYESFLNCPKVETLTIPSSVTSITNYPFSGLTGLKTLNFHAKTVQGSMFENFPIETLDLTGVETIGQVAFRNCTALKTLTLSNSLKTINHGAFNNCNGLTELSIPSSVTTIGSDAFWNCVNLRAVTVRWDVPLVLNINTTPFSGITTRYVRLNVPEGTADAYLLADVWRAFQIETGYIQHYEPNKLGNNGNVSISIYGARLSNAATVELIQGSKTIKAESITESNPGQFVAAFTFHQIPTGKYDLHIAEPTVVDTLISGAVTVIGIDYPKIVPAMDCRFNFRGGLPFIGTMSLRNTGNVDALGVSVYIALPKGVKISTGCYRYKGFIDTTDNFNFYCEEFGQTYSIPNSRIVALMDKMYQRYDIIPIDTLYGKPYDGYIYPFYLPKIAAGSGQAIEFELLCDQGQGQLSQIVCAVESPNYFNPSFANDSISWGAVARIKSMFDYYIAYDLEPERWQNVTDSNVWIKTLQIAEEIAIQSQLGERGNRAKAESVSMNMFAQHVDNSILYKQIAAVLLTMEEISKNNSIEQRADGILNFGGVQKSMLHKANGTEWIESWGTERVKNPSGGGFWRKVQDETYSQIISNAPLGGGAASEGLNVAAHGIYVVSKYKKQFNEVYDGLFGDNNGQGDAAYGDINVGGSWDPNEIYGPTGAGEAHYISGGEEMFYKISFENKDSADLPAMFVNIYDTLDVSKYDLSTFSFGDIWIGDSLLQAPSFTQSYYREQDMRPAIPYKVGITGSIDTLSGIVHWRFETLDPLTLAIADDPLAGFLPPNVTPPEGEGSVSFRVKLKENLAHNTVIPNQASIIFDFNEPIATNVWENTLDLLPPVSMLSTDRQNDSVYSIKFHGADAQSGVRYHKLYAKVNNGAFFSLGSFFGEEFVFEAMRDTLYSFYAEAVDNVGNAETKTAATETTVLRSDVRIKDITPPQEQMVIYPNPANGQLRIMNYELREGDVVEIYSVVGQLVYQINKPTNQQQITKSTNNQINNTIIDISHLATGMYYLKIGEKTMRFVKE